MFSSELASSTAAGAAHRTSDVPAAVEPEVVGPGLSKRERDARIRQLVDAHIHYVARVLRNLGMPAMDVDDGVQRTFIVASNRLDDIQPGCEKGFLFRVATRVAAHARRSIARRTRVIVMAHDEPIERAAVSERVTEETWLREMLDAILDQMPFEIRSVFVLHEFEGMTRPEIAKMLEIPPGTVASRLRRARLVFRSNIEALER